MTAPLLAIAIVAILVTGSQPFVPVYTAAESLQIATPEPAQPAGSFIRVYAEDTPGLVKPEAIVRRGPTYTSEAMRAKVQGNIALDVTVGADGRVRDAMVKTAFDPAYGLDAQAVTAASGWVFKPGILDGKAVPVRTTVVLSFKLY